MNTLDVQPAILSAFSSSEPLNMALRICERACSVQEAHKKYKVPMDPHQGH